MNISYVHITSQIRYYHHHFYLYFKNQTQKTNRTSLTKRGIKFYTKAKTAACNIYGKVGKSGSVNTKKVEKKKVVFE